MEEHSLYTIGHGRRKAEDLLVLLKDYGIEYLIDVRSVPYSGFNPQFNQPALRNFVEAQGLRYVYMGDTLGGRPNDPLCYDLKGKVNYEIVRNKTFFKEGIERLKTIYKKKIHAAILCSESKPKECHRSKLIGAVLAEEKFLLKHIDEHGGLITQEALFG